MARANYENHRPTTLTPGTLARLLQKTRYQYHGYKTQCLMWTGAKTHDGYAWGRGPLGSGKAHTIWWEHLFGPRPPGLVPDHLCRNRACIREDHIEWVTQKVNVQRGVEARKCGR